MVMRDKDAFKQVSPSLGETLAALGYQALRHGGTSQCFLKHKSSYDAACTLVAVIGIVTKLGVGEKLIIQEHKKKSDLKKIQTS